MKPKRQDLKHRALSLGLAMGDLASTQAADKKPKKLAIPARSMLASLC
jgi:hypothetical protein